jgi:hypothetical protein
MKNSLFQKIGSWLLIVLAIAFVVTLFVTMMADIYLREIGQPGLCMFHSAPCAHFLEAFIK